ncbi:MAG: peptide chain release factor N(5)-glutamine methyltransferase [Flavobacteriaceae bacterium]|nr:peptide chain release factor N(5)-glutamine methyltransferase [Flavobacteriaceae bacterium]
MKLNELKRHFAGELDSLYPSEEIQSFFSLLSEEYLNMSRYEVAINSEISLSEENMAKFKSAIHRLQQQEPIQYIMGKTEFYGLPFIVNEHTLIPRPETEELVSWILEEVSQIKTPLKILDMGTGTGCIAISLAKNLANAMVTALDISEEAIKTSHENAKINVVKVEFMHRDVLNIKVLDRKYDIIVSNPPYVRQLEKREMNSNVLDYEPSSALYVSDDDPLLFYQKISKLAFTHLTENGRLFFEINEYLGKEMESLLLDEGFTNVEIRKDIFEKDRMIKCSRHESTS